MQGQPLTSAVPTAQTTDSIVDAMCLPTTENDNNILAYSKLAKYTFLYQIKEHYTTRLV